MNRSRRLRRPVAALVGLVTCMSVALGSGAPVGAEQRATQGDQAPDSPGRVLIVTFPRVTWEQVRDVAPPVLSGFLADAAVASSSTRTVGRRTPPAQAYLTIGAGNRASAVELHDAGFAAAPDEETAEGRASSVYQRRTGHRAEDGGILNLTFPSQVARNDRLLYGTEPGALGQALRDAGIAMAAVGNAGRGRIDQYNREVALAAADSTGLVPAGDVSGQLIEIDDLSPFGVRANHASFVEAVDRAWGDADVLIAEMSDLERAERARSMSTPERADHQLEKSLMRSDQLFGELLGTVDLDRDLVIVVGPTAPLAEEQLTMFGIRGPDHDAGWATSPTTRRDGYVTLSDIAPTVLRWFDVDAPASMYVTPITGNAGGGDLESRIDAMVRDNSRAMFRDQATGPITVGFIVALVALALVVAGAIARGWRVESLLRVLSLAVLAVPAVIYLAGLLPYGPFTTPSYGVVVAVASLVIALLVSPLQRVDRVLAPLAVTGLCLVVLLVDVATGAHLQLNTMFGYSPIVAGRFAGFGNQAFALVGICSLVVATAGWDLWERKRPDASTNVKSAAVAVLFLTVVALVGAPMYGSDVGGVLAAVPAFAVCALLLRGRRINVRGALGIAVGAIAMLGAFALVDLSRPAESRTHLGRFVGKVVDGEAALILQRKLDTNLNILTSTVWTLTIPVALAFFAYLTWRPNGLTRAIERSHPSFRTFGISALTLGVVAFALNDSGVALPAMMLGIVLPYTAYLALGVIGAEEAEPEPDPSREPEGAAA